MIIKFKLYEEVNQNELEEGDYVIVDDIFQNDTYCRNTVARLVEMPQEGFENHEDWKIEFTNVPDDIIEDMEGYIDFDIDENNKNVYIFVYRNEILFWSKSKKELELVLQATKYNL